MPIKEYFSLSYLLDPIPPQESKLYIPLLIMFSLLVVLSILISFVKQGQYIKFIKKFFYPFLTCGVLGLLYLFSRYEGLPVLGSRFFLLVVMLIFLIWIFYNLIWIILNYSKFKNIKTCEDRYKEYLPKNKKEKYKENK